MAPSFRTLGTEFRANTYTTNDQGDPKVAANPATGGFQIVWESDGQDGDGLGVFGQNYQPTGLRSGTEFMINTVTVGDQQNADVAFDEDGNGAWVWQTNAIWNTGNDLGFDAVPIDYLVAENWRTRSKTFGFEAEEGFEVWNEERVRYGRTFSEVDNNAINPTVLSLGDGHFVSSMQRLQRGSDVVVDEFIPAGNNPPTNPRDGNWSRAFTEDEITPRGHTTTNDIAQLNDLTLIVVSTMTSNADTGAQGIIQFQPFIRRLGNTTDPTDRGQGAAFRLGERVELEGSGLTGPTTLPKIAVLRDGGFVITWSEYNVLGATAHYDSYAQVFNADLSARTSVLPVHDASTGEQVRTSVTALNDGGFMVAYSEFNGTGANAGEILMQRFDEDGLRLGKTITANETTSGRQADVDIATLTNGDVVATWESAVGDGNGKSVRGQVFDILNYGASAAQDITGTSAADRISTGARNDSVDGAGGNDRILGGTGSDKLFGGDGKDNLQGNAGNDKMNGDAGNDNMSGGDGKDVMNGGTGNDRINGGAGNDKIAGQAGNDRMTGGGGSDRFVFDGGRDTITDFQDNADTVVFDADVNGGRLTVRQLGRIVEERADSLFFNFGSDRIEINGINDFADLRNDLAIA